MLCFMWFSEDKDTAYEIVEAWIEEHYPLSEKDNLFLMDTESGFQTQTINGDEYYSKILNITYRNKYYRLMSGDTYENLIAEGNIYM